MKTSKIEIISVLFFVYILPIILIIADVIPFSYKFHVLVGGAIVMAVYFLLIKKVKIKELGISRVNALASLKDIMPITLIMLALTVVLVASGKVTRIPNEEWTFFIFYIFISSPAQEFLFRSSLFQLLSEVDMNDWTKTIFSSAIYSFIHVIYLDLLTVLVTFVIGIFWFRSYSKTKNLFGVSVSHAVLGVLTIATGVID